MFSKSKFFQSEPIWAGDTLYVCTSYPPIQSVERILANPKCDESSPFDACAERNLWQNTLEMMETDAQWDNESNDTWFNHWWCVHYTQCAKIKIFDVGAFESSLWTDRVDVGSQCCYGHSMWNSTPNSMTISFIHGDVRSPRRQRYHAFSFNNKDSCLCVKLIDGWLGW